MKILTKKLFYSLYINPLYNNFYNKKSLKLLSTSPIYLYRENVLDFDSMINQRRNEAKRSALLKYNAPIDSDVVHNYCSTFGPIGYSYEFNSKSSRNLLIQFQDEKSLQDLMQNSSINTPGSYIDIPFLSIDKQLIFSVSNHLTNSKINKNSIIQRNPSIQQLEDDIQMKCKTVSEQMQLLYENLKLSDFGSRIRFLICRKVEYLFPLCMAHTIAIPFGSSVNSFGKFDCDLDILICTDQVKTKKQSFGNENSKTHLRMIADLMASNEIGFSKILRIMNARVPIIKCTEKATAVECDISMDYNKGAYYMSGMLYTFGCLDSRVRPFIYAVRWWALRNNISQTFSPSHKITNFSLTMLCLFYLMTRVPRVIPCIEDLKSYRGVNTLVFTAANFSSIPISENEESLEELFFGFCDFYSRLHLKKSIFSLHSGNMNENEWATTPLYIENPIETDLNVSRNVSYEQAECFQEKCRKTYNAKKIYLPKRAKVTSSSAALHNVFQQKGSTTKPHYTNATRKKNSKEIRIRSDF